MDNFEEQNCRLCLDAISDNNFEKISDITEEMLDILLLKLDLDKNKCVMCHVCARKMREALKFKSMCLSTNNIILPYVDDETGNSVDLLEIYAKEKRNEQLIGHKVCRLCMKLINGKYMLVPDLEIDAIEKYIPEIDINVVEDPVICKQCFDSLGIHSTFIKNCLKVEEKIISSWTTASALCVKIENSVVKREESYYEEECVKNKLDVGTFDEGDQYQIKSECIDVKSEESNERISEQLNMDIDLAIDTIRNLEASVPSPNPSNKAAERKLEDCDDADFENPPPSQEAAAHSSRGKNMGLARKSIRSVRLLSPMSSTSSSSTSSHQLQRRAEFRQQVDGKMKYIKKIKKINDLISRIKGEKNSLRVHRETIREQIRLLDEQELSLDKRERSANEARRKYEAIAAKFYEINN